MADSSERSEEKPVVTSAHGGAKPKVKKVQGGRVVESRYLQYEKKTKEVSMSAKGEKPSQGRQASAGPRSKERQLMGTEDLQSTMLEGHGTALPDLDLSAIKEKSMFQKAPQIDRTMLKKAEPASFTTHEKKIVPRKKKRDLQETMDIMESQTLLLTLLSVKMEKNLALLEEKAEKDLATVYHERERLKRQVLELRHQLLLGQKQEELSTFLDAQIELLSPLAAVAEHFKEQYRKLAIALDTTRHELPVQAIHMQGSGRELLDDLEPALRTTLQLLGELGISSPDASTQVQCLLEEFKDLVAKRDLELQRLVSQLDELSSQASKEAALMNQEVWEEAQGTPTCSQWYFSRYPEGPQPPPTTG
ncbi:HAUS augmin-like complex subunit 8 isoform X2 [Meriones unguiculatus]|uniref:HAUS augmin-like complex subunit 8 isoform X2 n=1 Tax=Meriones unguiculatus TaxID=10047 RepID=UPI00293F3BB4|nr:HAUS augmin-like complex subunit 8 isoform X2 [Meriones unguiculatus]